MFAVQIKLANKRYPELLPQNSIFLNEVLDDVLLPLIQPACNGNDEKRKWIQGCPHQAMPNTRQFIHPIGYLDRVSGQYGN